MKILLVHTPFEPKRPLTLVALGIRKVCKTHWNHCALLIELLGIKLIIESDIQGVRVVPLSNWVKKQEVKVYDVPKSSRDYKKAFSKCGKVGYSFVDLFWFMPIYIITGQFYGRKVDGFSNKPTCYELIAWLFDFEDWYKITPTRFEEHLEYSNYICEGTIKATELL
jgi:hypothetical protein